MRVLLVQHASNNGLTSFPIGLGCVAAVLLEAGHDVDFIDLGLEENAKQALEDRIAQFQAQALGFTFWTTNYSEYVDLIKSCPAAANLPKVAGGPHACATAEQILREGYVDVVALCEGELIADHLFSTLAEKGDLSSVKGIAYLDGETYVETEDAGVIEDLESYPSPPYEMMNVNSYFGRLKGRPSVEMMVSRGCPFSCAFCYRGPSSGTRMRRMSTDKVMEELRVMREQYGFTSFFFVDDTFTLDREWAVEFCQKVIDSGEKIAWACQTRVDRVDRELLALMKKSGCVCIHFGVESGNQEIMNNLVKKITKDQVRKAHAECQRIRLSTITYFLIGTPWDTEETVRETIDFAKELKATISLFFAATPYPGCPMRETYIEKGMPVPEHCDEFGRFYTEDAPKESEKEVVRAGNLDSYQLSIDATRKIVRAQVRDVASYPRLITEFIDQYGFVDFVKNAAARLRV